MRGLTLVLTAFVAGCASAGTRADPRVVAGFVPGQTTVAQAEAALGTPNGQSHSSDGATVLIYSYAHSSLRPTTFIPIVGAFAGGSDTRTETATLHFGPDGRFLSSTSGSGSSGIGTGLLAQ
jgi:hypothetical protein